MTLVVGAIEFLKSSNRRCGFRILSVDAFVSKDDPQEIFGVVLVLRYVSAGQRIVLESLNKLFVRKFRCRWYIIDKIFKKQYLKG